MSVTVSNKTQYVCPRYNQNPNKTDMNRHLYRVRLCSDENGLELTDEIRESVLKNHKY